MNSLRIIGGIARGTRLRSVPGDTTRPITDRVKEALFNILGEDIRGAAFLDLFAGTGSVGIEALSRGASYVHLNDINRTAIETIQVNLDRTRLSKGAKVTRIDAFTFLRQPPERAFDYIYIAPPQYKNLWKEILTLVDQHNNWLSLDGWVIVQIDPIEYEKTPVNHLFEFDLRRYGSTLLVFYTSTSRDEIE